MRTLTITLLCLLVFGAEAQARGHRTAIQHMSNSCYRSDDIMRPCVQSVSRTVEARSERLKHLAERLERRGRKLIAYEPSYRQSRETSASAPAREYSTAAQVVGSRPSGCPHAYCGCGTSLHVFGKIVPDLNLAANWRRFPSTAPAAGMVAYRSGHVFAIESVNSDGTVVAYDSNSGRGLTRVHTVSLRGYRVVNPHGG